VNIQHPIIGGPHPLALTVTEVDELRDYLIGVMERADDHAGDVRNIALALAGAILWRKDDGEPIQVRSHNGQAANVLWARIGGTRYAFSYNHQAAAIDMRRDTLRGPTLHSFTNATPLVQIRTVFEAL
jgi:hypothetical protein